MVLRVRVDVYTEILHVLVQIPVLRLELIDVVATMTDFLLQIFVPASQDPALARKILFSLRGVRLEFAEDMARERIQALLEVPHGQKALDSLVRGILAFDHGIDGLPELHELVREHAGLAPDKLPLHPCEIDLLPVHGLQLVRKRRMKVPDVCDEANVVRHLGDLEDVIVYAVLLLQVQRRPPHGTLWARRLSIAYHVAATNATLH
mmetsp:Transcript_86429/g.241828  ORF Transcript_86429/g.241828 Transcript_86429/m.241828 type:complete len:206 (-) Transcript_86429:163-780(-)